MRIWTLHPRLLDGKGLVALWRETLLAQNVLLGKTKGYKNHPQLNRFKKLDNPVAAIGAYLYEVYMEADRRGYSFNHNKIVIPQTDEMIPVTAGQVAYELSHLLQKLQKRDIHRYNELKRISEPQIHPLFNSIPGGVEEWEVV